MYCHKCGKSVQYGSKFCSHCGASLNGSESEQTVMQQQNHRDESNILFTIFCFFIPIVGLILYLVWCEAYPLKARSCLDGFLANVFVCFVLICCASSTALSIICNATDGENLIDIISKVISYVS